MEQIILQIDFPVDGPFGEEMSAAYAELSQHLAKTPGLIWKIWTENAETKEAGGIYLFEDRDSAEAYLTEHTARLKSFGIQDIRGKIYNINVPLSKTTHFYE